MSQASTAPRNQVLPAGFPATYGVSARGPTITYAGAGPLPEHTPPGP